MDVEKRSSFGIAAVLILVIISFGVFLYPDDSTENPEEVITHADMHLSLTQMHSAGYQILYAIPEKPNLNPEGKLFFEDFKPLLDEVTLPTCDIVMESIGNYWVTNYCPAECGGSWATSSGATCHRSSYEDRLTIPTTCAIDLSVNDYGDLFYIPAFDRVFIAEDTGSGVKGKWLDLFYEDYSDVVNFPVGYYEVYSVEYVYGEVPANNYSIQPFMKQPFIAALDEYNYEHPIDLTILFLNPSPFTKVVILDIYDTRIIDTSIKAPYLR